MEDRAGRGSRNAVAKSAENAGLSRAEIVRLAVVQHSDLLKTKHPNIESVSDARAGKSFVVAIYVNDDVTHSIAKTLAVNLPDGKKARVRTEVIANTGKAKPHLGQSTDELSDSKTPGYLGSICCIVSSTTNPDFKGVVTSGHVFTYGNNIDLRGILAPVQQRDVLINGKVKGKLIFQRMKFDQDLAIVQLNDQSNLMDNYISFQKGYYKVGDADVSTNTPNITIASRNGKVRDAYILDYNTSFEIGYPDVPAYVRNIILVGSTRDRDSSATLSEAGDSGSCVYHKKSGKLIGMLLGGNNKFTFVLPLEETLNAFNFKPL